MRGAGGENRTLTKLPSVDFESTASTVPPLQRRKVPKFAKPGE